MLDGMNSELVETDNFYLVLEGPHVWLVHYDYSAGWRVSLFVHESTFTIFERTGAPVKRNLVA